MIWQIVWYHTSYLIGGVHIFFRVGHSLVTKYLHAWCKMEFLSAMINGVPVPCSYIHYKKCNVHRIFPISLRLHGGRAKIRKVSSYKGPYIIPCGLRLVLHGSGWIFSISKLSEIWLEWQINSQQGYVFIRPASYEESGFCCPSRLFYKLQSLVSDFKLSS